MKIVFKMEEIKSMKGFIDEIGVSSVALDKFFNSLINSGYIPEEFNPISVTQEQIDEVNRELGHMLQIIILEDEIHIDIKSEMVIDSARLYKDGILEVIELAKHGIKVFYMFYVSRVKAFIDKWFKPIMNTEETSIVQVDDIEEL